MTRNWISPNYCYHCGTETQPWRPLCGDDGSREDRPERWCPNCSWVVEKSMLSALDGYQMEMGRTARLLRAWKNQDAEVYYTDTAFTPCCRIAKPCAKHNPDKR
jgi:hypothetical protein